MSYSTSSSFDDFFIVSIILVPGKSITRKQARNCL
jgi:hypothetical protein